MLFRSLLDASVGSTAFLIRQLIGSRAIRVNVPLQEDYGIDDPEVMGRLDSLAVQFMNSGSSAIRQPDGTNANLKNWLDKYWYDVPNHSPVATTPGDEHHVPV